MEAPKVRRSWRVATTLYKICDSPRILVAGLGWAGRGAAKLALERGLRIVGAVDPRLRGRDLGEVLGVGVMGLKIAETVGEALEGAEAEVALHTAASHLADAHPQLLEIMAYGLNVVTSSEELLYPEFSDVRLAHELDQIARRYRVSLVAVRVNPGFAMDRLPAYLARACKRVRRVEVTRVVDLSRGPEALRKKAGVGTSPEEFEWLLREGVLGHVGLPHSAAFLASALGLEVDRIVEEVEALIAEEPVRAGGAEVKRGHTKGMRHVCQGLKGVEAVIRLELRLEVGAEAKDEIVLEGEPPLRVAVVGGIPEEATPALMVNAIPWALTGAPGLHVLEGPPWACPWLEVLRVSREGA